MNGMTPTRDENEMFTEADSITYYDPGQGSILRRDSDKEFVLTLGNGGHIRLVSETPIKAFLKAE